MRFTQRVVACVATILFFATCSAFGQARAQGGKQSDFADYDPNSKPAEKGTQPPPTPASVTHHQMSINGQPLAYTATADTLPIRNATTEAVEGDLFYVYYAKDGVSDVSKRPVTFVFNGGPGAAAIWLHMVGFGPKRVVLTPEGKTTAPPYTYKDNPNTLLDQTDLVFLDPVGTGYSRPSQPDEAGKFWGMANDVSAVAEFIRLFLVRHDRFASPTYILGESYGTYRAAELSSYLIDRNIPLNGVILVSSLFEDETREGDAQYVNFLPTFAEVAWYHHRLASDLQKLTPAELAKKAEEFASGEYLHALYQGARLSAEEKEKVANDLAHFTGLSKKFVEDNDLRVTLRRFQTELLRDQAMIIGRLDGRMTAHASDTGAIEPPFDAADAEVGKAVYPVFNQYIRGELGYKTDRIYFVSGKVQPWPGARQASPDMENTFDRNPHMKLFVAMGYFDQATIYYGFQWSLSHLRIAPEVRAHDISFGYYPSGHMIYTDEKSLEQLRHDLRKWY